MTIYKAAIRIQLRKQILDVQGKAVEQALHALEFSALNNVRIGKFVELDVEASSKENAEAQVRAACAKLIANPVMEDFHIELREL
jgi:phosphoribosylformylglycinamidine synthase